MLKKLFVFILFLAIIGGGYYYWTNTQNEQQQVVAPLQQGMVKLADPNAISPVASVTNTAILYGLSTGRMMKYYLETQDTTEYPLPEILTKSFDKLLWPRSGNDFIAATKLDGQLAYFYYNSKTNQYNKLPANMVNLDWVNNGRQIVYVWQANDGKVQLAVSGADGTGYRVIREIPWGDVVLKASPTNNTVLMYKEVSGQPVSKIYLYDLETGEYTEAVTEGNNTGAVWAPDGTAFGYTVLDGKNSKVMYHNLATGQNFDTGLVSTIDKVAFSQDGKIMYVASMNENNQENMWEYNTQSKITHVVFTAENIKMRNIVVIGKKLFFLSQDNTLYSYQ